MIYVVEDNAAIRENIVAYLKLAGHEVQEFDGLSGVVEAVAFREPALILLDVMLPDGNGFALAQTLRRRHPNVPFVFLTAREAESDRITGLELGAEDYVVKPFSPRELVLRVEAVLRRCSAPQEQASTLRRGGVALSRDASRHEVSVGGRVVDLTLAEWKLLGVLIANAGRVVTREHLLGEGLDYRHDGSDRTLNTHIKNLRAKLAPFEGIETLRGVGYRLEVDP